MHFLYQGFGWVLYQIFRLVGDYGYAVILFTVIVKTIILPLNIKQTNSMKEMQAITPEVQKLQKKYKNNPEKLNMETMKLYKLYKVNPMSGCLPLLIQLPIIWGLFGALQNPQKYVFTSGNLSALHQSFYWIPNLGKPDPYYILPIVVVVVTFLTQKFTTDYSNADPATATSQKVMMIIMPLMIGWFALKMPAGVSLYWVTQSVYTFVQQFIVMRRPVKLVPIEEAERRVKEQEEKDKREKRDKLKASAEIRQQAMNAQFGRSTQKSSKMNRPKTRPASKRRVVTKIPHSDERTKKPDKSN
jgi:YidC/Oxa1 family membrane protein insertase